MLFIQEMVLHIFVSEINYEQQPYKSKMKNNNSCHVFQTLSLSLCAFFQEKAAVVLQQKTELSF